MNKTETQHEEIRIIIIGASRSGKSTAANVLLGKNIFQVSADTRQRSHMTCQFGMTKTEHGYVKVLDTPDLQAPKLREESKVREEIQKWKTMCPDAHLILLAIRCDSHDLDADVMRFNKFRRLWGDNLRRRLVVLFTFGDKLQKDIDELLARSHPTLQDIMDCAGHRYVIFDSSLGASKQDGRVHQVFNFVSELRHGFNVLIIGKSKSGKSNLGNYLLNTTAFSVSRGPTSSTTHTVTRSAEIDGVAITVTDTPDLRNLGIVKTSTEEEIKKWYAFHPDIILLAIRCDVCYSAEEHQMYQQIKKVLGEKYFTSILIVAFTFGDRLGKNIDEELKTVCSELKDVLKEAGHRYIVFSNEDPVQDRKKQFMRLRAFAFNEGAPFECNESRSESTIPIKPTVQGASETLHGDMLQVCQGSKTMCDYDDRFMNNLSNTSLPVLDVLFHTINS
ncbi:GTPase IMAP family member 8-like [Pomacea canaliculata]|uniref:GTPase IMAP family member 8-like n=1 Tax=Pomacea canaliculata TaxID=400727 RepID=UPI000D735D00|nr:GTPase IMAP family member 8-like [Pomacea canaliculata]